jgi:magnesium-transporting ATPase (P-type)
LPEDPPTPIWELILEQFKDQLVIILLGSAAVSFVLALFEDEEGWAAFVDPAVVRIVQTPSRHCADPALDRSSPFSS